MAATRSTSESNLPVAKTNLSREAQYHINTLLVRDFDTTGFTDLLTEQPYVPEGALIDFGGGYDFKLTRYKFQAEKQTKTTNIQDRSNLNLFPNFSKLPIELRTQIWDIVNHQRPRKIHLRCSSLTSPFSTQAALPVTTAINHETLDDAFSLQRGYCKLKRTQVDTTGAIFHPGLDMLYFDAWTGCGARDIGRALWCCGAMDKVKCVAIHEENPDFYEFIATFKDYTSLELVFIVHGPPVYMPKDNWAALQRAGEDVMFWAMEEDKWMQSMRDYFERELRKGRTRIVPHFEFVSEVKRYDEV